MNYLLDTCVLSELIKKKPDEKLLRWISEQDETRLFISVLTLGEIHKGIEKLPKSKKKNRLHDWVNLELTERFENRIVDLDLKSATTWGETQARSEKAGEPMPTIDGLIAATGIAYGLTIVTRNVADMKISGARILNPWE